MKIVKGDTVYLRSGKDVANSEKGGKGVRGRVLRVLPEDRKVVVEGLNMVTKHLKPGASGGAAGVQQGGRMKMEAALPMCRVMLVCPNCDKPTRVGLQDRDEHRQTLRSEKPVTVRERVCKQCGEVIPRPTDTRLA